MKKLMIAACVIAFAAVSQAAVFDWSYDAYGETGIPGSKWYLFVGDGSEGAALATILSDQGADAFATALSGYTYSNGQLSDAAAAAGEGVAAVNGQFATMFIFDDGVVAGKTFAYNSYELDNTYLYEPPSGGTALEMWGDDGFTTGTIKDAGPGPIPEPTSGLLLLLGVAGLALRRRRA